MAIYTIEQYNALVSAIAEGTLRVRYSDKEVQYRTIAEMLQIKKMMERDLGLIASGSSIIRPNYKKGI